LVEKRIVEGQHVAAGEVLYVVSSERVGGSGSATQAAIGEQLARRRSSLIEQIDSTRALETVERDALAKRLATLRTEMAKFDDVLATHAQRLDLLTATAERRRRLRDLGFLSEDQWRAAEADLLDQRGRLRSLDRERAAAERVRAELEGLAASLGLEYANALAELTRAVAATDLEIAENDARRGVVVTAPRAGTVTAVAAQVGQPVEAALPLGFIVPIDAVLIAELYAPSRAVGFVAPGAEVRLRYAAFPYQKFGHARGIVATISQTTLATFDSSRQETRSEPLYRVVVTLEAQTVSAYGEARRLLPGMEVEADVLQETRRLYEWVLEPLYAMAARLDR
jgi:membrane fusion protein